MSKDKFIEYCRSAELFVKICRDNNEGPYYALAFLMDSGYTRRDILRILDIVRYLV